MAVGQGKQARASTACSANGGVALFGAVATVAATKGAAPRAPNAALAGLFGPFDPLVS